VSVGGVCCCGVPHCCGDLLWSYWDSLCAVCCCWSGRGRLAVAESLGIPKTKPVNDPEYRAWISSMPCCVCYRRSHRLYPQTAHIYPSQSDCHHIEAGGMGTKCSDHLTVPLCRRHHRQAHDMGKAKFPERYQINLHQIADELVEIYQGSHHV